MSSDMQHGSFYGAYPLLPLVEELMMHLNLSTPPYFRLPPRDEIKLSTREAPPLPPLPPLPPFPTPALPAFPIPAFPTPLAKVHMIATDKNNQVKHNFGEHEGKGVVMHLCVQKPDVVFQVAAQTTTILQQLNEWIKKQKRKVISQAQMTLISKQTGLSENHIMQWLTERKTDHKQKSRS